MIEVRHSSQPHPIRVIEARSNLSMTLDRLALVFLGLSAVTLLVALGPLILGYWPIMLAAIVHLLVVGWCLRIGWRGNWARERLTIDRDKLEIDHYDARQRTHSEWPAAWVRVLVEEQRLGERQVVVTCCGRRQIVGRFLPAGERLELADALRKNLGPIEAGVGKSNHR
ncbi:DUF2244 domain-containing protein [Wenzhouxiangella sp. XN201]|uniref:DUF2244 domain-containing protein n=1 Tax=Wenzhouxiangella sp. XN201 TaxID=2710755 RepID=UPI0013C8EE32|nr:DUF2244 domain-containing protein [Wenzhouxiangella sp. XN201]